MSPMRTWTRSMESELRVTVRLFANLRDYTPEGADPRAIELLLPSDAAVGDAARALNLPQTLWKTAFRNSTQCRDPDAPLADGDIVAFFPPIAGG